MHMLVFALLIEYHAIPCRPTSRVGFPCADPGFRQGGPELSFFKVPEGVQHFPGGVQLFPGGPIAYTL